MSFEDIFQSFVIRNQILEYLNDKEKFSLTSINKFFSQKRNSIILTDLYVFNEYLPKWKFFDKIKILKTRKFSKLPKSLEILQFEEQFEGDFEKSGEFLNFPKKLKKILIHEYFYNEYRFEFPDDVEIYFLQTLMFITRNINDLQFGISFNNKN